MIEIVRKISFKRQGDNSKLNKAIEDLKKDVEDAKKEKTFSDWIYIEIKVRRGMN